MKRFWQRTILFAGILLCTFDGVADKFQVSIMFMPSYEGLNFRGRGDLNGLFGNKLSYNAGFEYRYFLAPNLAFATGLQYNNKGFRNTEIPNEAGVVQSESSDGILIGSARFISIPTDLSAHFRLSKRTSFLLTGGFSTGYLTSQTLNGKDLLPDQETSNGLFQTANGKSNIDLFSTMYFGLNAGIGITQQIGARMIFGVHPTYRRQLSRAIPQDARINETVNSGFDSFTFDLKWGWYFNKQFQNKEKTF